MERNKRPTTIGAERAIHGSDGVLLGYIGETSEAQDGGNFYARRETGDTTPVWFATADAAEAHLRQG